MIGHKDSATLEGIAQSMLDRCGSLISPSRRVGSKGSFLEALLALKSTFWTDDRNVPAGFRSSALRRRRLAARVYAGPTPLIWVFGHHRRGTNPSEPCGFVRLGRPRTTADRPRRDDADGGQAEHKCESPTEATAELSGFGRMTTASIAGQIGLAPAQSRLGEHSDLRLSRWAGGYSAAGSSRRHPTNHFSDDVLSFIAPIVAHCPPQLSSDPVKPAFSKCV